MIIISAMSEDRIIGSGEGMPWNVPVEYQQYLRFVSGNAVIMGRRTYEIFGQDLPDTTDAIVVTRSRSVNGATVSGSLEEAITLAGKTGKTIYIAGGGSIYQQAIDVAEQMYLSTIKGDFEGDTYFPKIDENNWEIAEERDEAEFVFRIYVRRSNT